MHALVVANCPDCLRRLCGLTVVERLVRTLEGAGAAAVTVVSLLEEAGDAELRDALGDAIVRTVERPPGASFPESGDDPRRMRREDLLGAWPDSEPLALVAFADASLDPRLARRALELQEPSALVDRAPPVGLAPLVMGRAPVTDRGLLCGVAVVSRRWLEDGSGGANAGGPAGTIVDRSLEPDLVAAVESGELASVDVADEPGYTTRLRRFLRPWWFPAPGLEEEPRARRLLIGATQKGHPDLPAFVHRPFENALVRVLAPTPVTPNHVTLATTAIAWCATFLFATGRLLPGILVALAVNVLDGVDGKLARLRLQETAFGKLEHWLDAAFEASWWIAIAAWLQLSGQLPWAWAAALALGIAEAVDGWAKLQILRRLGHTIDELGAWERFVRLWGGRRNVYVWIMAGGVLLGHPATAYVVLPVWEGATALLHLLSVRRVLAARERRSGVVEA